MCQVPLNFFFLKKSKNNKEAKVEAQFLESQDWARQGMWTQWN